MENRDGSTTKKDDTDISNCSSRLVTKISPAASSQDMEQLNPSYEDEASFEREWDIISETNDESCTNLKQTIHSTSNDTTGLDADLRLALQQLETRDNYTATISIDEERGRNNRVGNSQLQYDDESVIKELKHLRKRVTNVQQSIQLCTAALRIPSNWEENCLNSVSNCIGEWRAIVSFHGATMASHSSFHGSVRVHRDDEPGEQHPMHPDSEYSKTTALEVFGLLQLAMQCGPLAGSNAGYFKRCGGTVALIAHTFLVKTVDGGLVQDLRFTEKQRVAIEKWTAAAKKAVEVDKPPSKTMLKLQEKAIQMNNRTSKKRSKGNRVK